MTQQVWIEDDDGAQYIDFGFETSEHRRLRQLRKGQ